MNSKFLRIAGVAILLGWFVLIAWLVATAPDIAPQSEPVIIMEDDPRWDCETMGNRLCGPGHHN